MNSFFYNRNYPVGTYELLPLVVLKNAIFILQLSLFLSIDLIHLIFVQTMVSKQKLCIVLLCSAFLERYVGNIMTNVFARLQSYYFVVNCTKSNLTYYIILKVCLDKCFITCDNPLSCITFKFICDEKDPHISEPVVPETG